MTTCAPLRHHDSRRLLRLITSSSDVGYKISYHHTSHITHTHLVTIPVDRVLKLVRGLDPHSYETRQHRTVQACVELGLHLDASGDEELETLRVDLAFELELLLLLHGLCRR